MNWPIPLPSVLLQVERGQKSQKQSSEVEPGKKKEYEGKLILVLSLFFNVLF